MLNIKDNKKRNILLAGAITISLFAIILTISFVGAEFWACADYQQVINYCNNYKPSKTCDSTNGCQYCMSVYNESENCYVHGVWPKCNTIPQDCQDVGGGSGGPQIDAQPPVLTINNPLNGEIYDSRTLLLDLEVNEKSDIHYTDLDNGRGRWTPVCSDCFGYERTRSFREGLNNLQFRAKDVVGNTAYKNVSFFIDSSKPRILKTEPKNGFTNGDFHIEFKEANPAGLYITYGDVNPGFNVHQINIGNECQLNEDNGKYYCDTYIDLSSYDGKEIQYWVNITDIAGNKVDSKKINGPEVDTTFPVINSLTTQINNKYATFNLDVTELNFDEATYSYTDTNGRLREGRLCSRLKDDGSCEKKVNFIRAGSYDVSVQVNDEAGNSVGQLVNVVIV